VVNFSVLACVLATTKRVINFLRKKCTIPEKMLAGYAYVPKRNVLSSQRMDGSESADTGR